MNNCVFWQRQNANWTEPKFNYTFGFTSYPVIEYCLRFDQRNEGRFKAIFMELKNHEVFNSIA